MCFGCGKNNESGLHLQCMLTEDGQAYEVDFIPQLQHQGYDGIIHGGILATVLDELSADFLRRLGTPGVTAELTIRYRQSAKPGEMLHGTARIAKQKGPLVSVQSELVDENGNVIVEGIAKIMTKIK